MRRSLLLLACLSAGCRSELLARGTETLPDAAPLSAPVVGDLAWCPTEQVDAGAPAPPSEWPSFRAPAASPQSQPDEGGVDPPAAVFAEAAEGTSLPHYAFDLQLADLDADGALDVLAATRSGLVVFAGRRSRLFGSREVYFPGRTIRDVALGA